MIKKRGIDMFKRECLSGICSRCKYWKILEILPGLKGKCIKREYIISCSHSCCEDFSEKEK